ncbi:MAG: VWA domain-containing protein [Candidatus Riflebacteria bacterium]|nr:VWA domain-containing protein [Candidatus Riflebacteria bacterium]
MRITIRPEFKYLPPHTPVQMHVMITFSAEIPGQVTAARNPISLAFVIDRSGSMQGEKLEKTKNALSEMVRLLTRRDRVTLVTFETEVQHPIKLTNLTDKPGIFNTIGNLVTGSSTNLSGGWMQGFTEIQENLNSTHINRIILLTDGQANNGITDEKTLSEMAVAFRQKGVSTSTFGFGNGFNENLLKEIAKNGGGNFYFISQPEDAVTSFRAEFGEIQHIAGQNCQIGFKFPPGVHFIEDFSHYRKEETPGEVRFYPGDLLDGVEGQIILRLELEKDFCEGNKDLFSFDHQFNSASGNFDLIKEQEKFSFTFREGDVQLFLDNEILDEIIMAKTAKAKSIAFEETQKGNKDKALCILEEREQCISDRLKSKKSLQGKLLFQEIELLNRLKKDIAGEVDNLGKTIQSQVEEYVKKRGVYIQNRKEKKFIFKKIFQAWNQAEMDDFFSETRTRLTDLGLEHDFLSKCLFCLTELVANAVGHGCHGKPDGEIQVKGVFKRGGCLIQVFDPGNGFAVEEVLEKAKNRFPEKLPSFSINSNEIKNLEKGRGIALMLALGADLNYTAGGREAMIRLENKVPEGILSFDSTSILPTDQIKTEILIRNHLWKGRNIPEILLNRESTVHDGRVFREIAVSFKQKGVLECILNMENVVVLNSIGIAELLSFVDGIFEAGGTVAIIITNSVIEKCLELVNIPQIAYLVKTLNIALEKFPDSEPIS